MNMKASINHQGAKPTTDASNRSYQLFLTVIMSVSMVSLCQQIHFEHNSNGGLTVQLPWEMEFHIRQKKNLRQKAQEEPFSQDEPLLNPSRDLKKVLALEKTEDDSVESREPIKKAATTVAKVMDEASKARQEKASIEYREKLRLRAQQLVPSQGGFSKNKNHIRAQATAAKNKLIALTKNEASAVAHVSPGAHQKDVAGVLPDTKFAGTVRQVAAETTQVKAEIALAKPGASKLAADTTPGAPKVVVEVDPPLKHSTHAGKRKRKKGTKSENHTPSTVPRLFGDELQDAIKAHIKPRRSKLPPLYLQMCHACENSFISERFSCKRRILPWIEKNPTDAALKEGQAFVANENDLCRACSPETCSAKIHYPYRFDEGTPLVLNAKTHDLASIPKNYRIPEEFLFMTDTYFKFWTQDRKPIFFTYNPSIIQVPANADIDVPGATYIAAYRVSPWHNCGFDTYNFHSHLWNLMGLALLDDNLDIIEGYDVVVDINEQSKMRDEIQKFEDFRLFYFNDRIWLVDGSLIVPIQIASNRKGKLNQMKERLPVLFGTRLTVGFLEPVQHILEIPPGKNYNIFTPPGGGILLETTPRHPRTTIELDFEGMIGAKENGEKHNYNTPPDSFVTDEVFLRKPYLLGRDKGTACCTKLEKEYFKDLTDDPELLKHDYLLMGIGHRRTFRKVRNEGKEEGAEKFDYLSRLYAFAPEAPFNVVANSGMFCFGFPDDEEAAHLPYANATKHFNKMEIYNKVYPSCPTVQKATGMIEKVGDQDRIIVSYGVNDCVPRVVELHKQDLAHRMFLPLSRQDYAVQTE